jgi:hypothetical protein
MTTTSKSTKPRHDVRNAWVSLALIPVSLFVADGVLHALLSLMGVDEGAGEDATVVQGLLAGLPYALVMMLPGIGGFVFGTNALGGGDGRGRIPSALGALWVLIVLLGSIVLLVTS